MAYGADGGQNGFAGPTPEFTLRWKTDIAGGVSALSWSADSKRLAVADDGDRGNSVFDVASRHRISYWRSSCSLHGVGIALMPDGKIAIACPQREGEQHSPGVVSIVDVDTGKSIRRITTDLKIWEHSFFAEPFVLSDDGRYMAAAPLGTVGHFAVFDTTQWSIVRSFDWPGYVILGHDFGQIIRSLAFTHDGRRIAVGAMSGALQICSISTGDCRHLTDAPAGWITALAFTPDDNMLISASRLGEGTGDGALNQVIAERSKIHLRGWNVASGEEVVASAKDDLDVHFMSIHPSGRFFAVAYRDKSDISIYTTSSFRQIDRIETSEFSWALAFSPDGTMLAASDFEHLMIYNIQPHD